jgi:hypothetical protein
VDIKMRKSEITELMYKREKYIDFNEMKGK